MRRLSKALIEQEQNETSVAICRAMALHDQCRVDVLNIISPAWNIFWLTWTKRRIPSRPYPVRSRQHSLFSGVSFFGSALDYI